MAKSKKNIIKLLCISILFLCSGCKKEKELCYFEQNVFLGNDGDGIDTPIIYVDKDNEPITCHEVIHLCPNNNKEHFVTSTVDGYVSGDVRINSCHLKNSMGAGYSMGKAMDSARMRYKESGSNIVYIFRPYSVFRHDIASHLKGEILDTSYARIIDIQGMEARQGLPILIERQGVSQTQERIVGDTVYRE